MKETPKALAAYREYEMMGPSRSLRKLAEETGRKRDENGTKTDQIFKQFGIWSASHNWQERVKNYDTEQSNLRKAEREKREREEEERQEELRRKYEKAVSDMLLEHIQSKVEASSTSQIQAAKLLMENFVFADKLKKMEAQQNFIIDALKQLGVNP